MKQPLYSTAEHTPIVKAKAALRAAGFPFEESRALVDQIYRAESYRQLAGRTNIYLTAPSTSRRNPLPNFLAKRLQNDFDGIIVSDQVATLAAQESKSKVGWLAKMADEVRVVLGPGLIGLLGGKDVVLVDDILTTGETISALRAELVERGILRTMEAVLTAKRGGHPASPANYENVARVVAKGVGLPVERIVAELRLAFPGVYAQFLQSALHDATDHPNAVYDVIRRKAGAL